MTGNRYLVAQEERKLVRRKAKDYAPEDKPLKRREELFVRELVSKDGQITMREAAINAGFPPRSAHARAHEMTNPAICPHIVKAIKRYRAELDQKYGVEYHRHLRDLQKIRDMALEAGAFSAAVQAEYRRGQAHGDIYVAKSEIRHGTIESMSKDEVLKAIQELKQQYEPVTIDITPEDKTNSGNRQKARERLLASGPEGDGDIDADEILDDDAD
jgi:phage terminase small subunit